MPSVDLIVSDARGFDLCFGQRRLLVRHILVGTDVRPFHQEHVDVGRRVAQQLLEDAALPPVAAEVARVEEASSVRLHQQRVRVEGAVIVEVGRDPEVADRERLTMDEEPVRGGRESAGPEGGLRQDPMGRLAHEDRDPGRDLVYQSPVILMRVGDDDGERRIARRFGSDRRVRHGGGVVAIERHAQVEDERLAGGAAHLDAAPADLMRPAMDPRPHPFKPP